MKRKILFNTIIITLILCLLCSCKIQTPDGYGEAIVAQAKALNYAEASEKISEASGLAVSAEFLEDFGDEPVKSLLEQVENGSYTELSWLETLGCSYHVVSDMLNGKIDSKNIENRGDNGKESFSFAFVGDILFDPDYAPMVHSNEKGGVLNCIDKAVVDYLNACDIFLINNEFSIGERGAPLKGKTWTFQAHPDRIQIFKDLGADIVSLANNHVYDYGLEGFVDTMYHLKNAGMPYVGAGMNVGEAAEGYYFIVNGIKVGVVAASRAEKVYFTPVANNNDAGVMGTYESERFIKAIKAADEQCDFLIAYVHWGTENSTVLEDAQKTMAREYIDAGVDAVIGGHTHCLQGMDFYKGAPIIYSVGNFWFNSKTLDSCVITLNFDRKMNVQTTIMPLKQQGCETRLLSDPEDSRALFDRVESYEPQRVKISDSGVITPVSR
ncbi:MAG: CapA family protein [Acutalibacteraceae bacterium]